MKQQKWIIWIICGAILLGAGFWYTKGQDPVTKESNFQASVSESSAPAGDTSKPVNTDSSEIAVFICGAVKHLAYIVLVSLSASAMLLHLQED